VQKLLDEIRPSNTLMQRWTLRPTRACAPAKTGAI
jgi:hypothetical protein